MLILAFVLSLSVVVLGALGIVSPMMLLGVVRKFESPAGIYAAAALRIMLGVALFLSAPTSRVQEIVRILGIIIFVMGIITPLFGTERFRRLLNWWSERGPVFMRVWAGFALGFDLFLAYAVMP
jgi:hypothetical protein